MGPSDKSQVTKPPKLCNDSVTSLLRKGLPDSPPLTQPEASGLVFPVNTTAAALQGPRHSLHCESREVSVHISTLEPSLEFDLHSHFYRNEDSGLELTSAFPQTNTQTETYYAEF